jgi:hypothetical protein
VPFCIELFQFRIVGTARLRGINTMLGVRLLSCQPSDAFDDVWTPVFDRVLVIIIPFHILDSV